MTLEALTMYLWHSMPLTGWGAILSAVGTITGTYIWLKGRLIIRENYACIHTLSTTADGTIVETNSVSVDAGYKYGHQVAQTGGLITVFALIAYVGFMSF